MSEQEEYKLLSTIRYDPHLAQVVSTLGNEDGTTTFKYLIMDARLILDTQYSGYRISDAPHNKDHFKQFQEDFSKSNDTLSPQNTELINLNDQEQFEDQTTITNNVFEIYKHRFFSLQQHVQRLNVTLQILKCTVDKVEENNLLRLLVDAIAADKADISSFINDETCYKMRVLIDKCGNITCEAHRLPSPSSQIISLKPTEYFTKVMLSGFLDKCNNDSIWNVFVDTQPIISHTPFTTFKTTNRNHYTISRNRMLEMATQLGLPLVKNEIIVYNDKKQVMEGSITNVAIKKQIKPGNYQWVTPKLSTGCLCGVARYYLLSKGFIKQYNDISISDLHKGDSVLLFNGIMGCVKGIIQ